MNQNKVHTTLWFLLVPTFVFCCVLVASSPSTHFSSQSTRLKERQGNPVSANQELLLLESNKATVMDLVNGLASTDPDKRITTAREIISLRDHYITSAQTLRTLALSGRAGNRTRWCAERILGQLRPTDQGILYDESKSVSFSYKPVGHIGLPEVEQANSTAYSLVRSSLPALAPLLTTISDPNINQELDTGKPSSLGVICVMSVLGRTSSTWLADEANQPNQSSRHIALVKAANITLKQWKRKPYGSLPNALVMFGGSDALEASYDANQLGSVDIAKEYIQWNTLDTVQDELKQSPGSDPISAVNAIASISRTMLLIEYGLIQRLETNSKERNKNYEPYPREAALTAVKVLGCMRSDIGDWVIWERVRAMSLTHPIESDTSEETAIYVRSLGQIDMPAVKLLTSRIESEWAEKQQAAATYTLSKILGKYTVPYLQGEITDIDVALAEDKANSDDYHERKQRIENMLKLGLSKSWFTNNYYGIGDPDAYKLLP